MSGKRYDVNKVNDFSRREVLGTISIARRISRPWIDPDFWVTNAFALGMHNMSLITIASFASSTDKRAYMNRAADIVTRCHNRMVTRSRKELRA